MKYKVLGITSGLGVSLYPFRKNVICNIEPRGLFHTRGNEQWKLNFGEIPLYGMLPAEKSFFEPIDVIISSPDCGSGSILRYSRSKELGDHKKNHSLLMFFESIKIFQPKFFEFENLDGLFKSFPEKDFREQVKNYYLIIHNAPVSNWGNSQINRKRLIIIGIRRDLPFKKLKKYFRLPNIPYVKTCKEIYGDLPLVDKELCHTREPITEIISIHARCRMSLFDIAQTWNQRLKGKKRWETEPGFKFSTAPGVYRNLDSSFPATARKANRQFDNMGLTLTPRQLARVQGVPDSFKLYYDDTKPKYCINKARCVITKTPPMNISYWFKRKLEKALKTLK